MSSLLLVNLISILNKAVNPMKKKNETINLTARQEENKEKKCYNYGDLVIMIWRRIKLKERIPNGFIN